MNWWSLFFKIRKTVYAFIAIASLGWAITLSIYLTREWSHFTHPQRGIVLGVIGVNGISAVLLYLMIVVVFRTWLDFARVLFLLLIHIGASLAVTFFSMHFSCVAFGTEQICKDVDLAFIIGSWVLTGLLLGYMIILLIMSRVPRPVPRITPNLLLDDPEKARHSRAGSLRSVNSATGLLRQDSTSSFGTIAPKPKVSPRLRSKPRTYRVANGMPKTPMTAVSPGASFPGTTYGATGTSARPEVPRLPPIQTSFSQSRRQSLLYRPPPLPLTNPFSDPLPSNTSSSDGLMTSLTFTGEQPVTYSTWTSGSFKPAMYQPVVPPSSGIPSSLPTGDYTAPPGTAAGRMYPGQEIESPTSIYSLYESGPPGYSSGGPSLNPFLQPAASPAWSAAVGPSMRMHTATPHSIHSVAPSMHLTHDVSHSALPAAHTRDGAQPVWRPHTADPHLHRGTSDHFAVGNAEVRRLPTMPSAQYQRSGHGGTYLPPRNAAHLAGALGKAPPRTGPTVASRDEWRQLVLRAASGQPL